MKPVHSVDISYSFCQTSMIISELRRFHSWTWKIGPNCLCFLSEFKTAMPFPQTTKNKKVFAC